MTLYLDEMMVGGGGTREGGRGEGEVKVLREQCNRSMSFPFLMTASFSSLPMWSVFQSAQRVPKMAEPLGRIAGNPQESSTASLRSGQEEEEEGNPWGSLKIPKNLREESQSFAAPRSGHRWGPAPLFPFIHWLLHSFIHSFIHSLIRPRRPLIVRVAPKNPERIPWEAPTRRSETFGIFFRIWFWDCVWDRRWRSLLIVQGSLAWR